MNKIINRVTSNIPYTIREYTGDVDNYCDAWYWYYNYDGRKPLFETKEKYYQSRILARKRLPIIEHGQYEIEFNFRSINGPLEDYVYDSYIRRFLYFYIYGSFKLSMIKDIENLFNHVLGPEGYTFEICQYFRNKKCFYIRLENHFYYDKEREQELDIPSIMKPPRQIIVNTIFFLLHGILEKNLLHNTHKDYGKNYSYEIFDKYNEFKNDDEHHNI